MDIIFSSQIFWLFLKTFFFFFKTVKPKLASNGTVTHCCIGKWQPVCGLAGPWEGLQCNGCDHFEKAHH